MLKRKSLIDLRSSWMFLSRSFGSCSFSGSICPWRDIRCEKQRWLVALNAIHKRADEEEECAHLYVARVLANLGHEALERGAEVAHAEHAAKLDEHDRGHVV
jgi:hypothetical protein